jgi:hypothetical protein
MPRCIAKLIIHQVARCYDEGRAGLVRSLFFVHVRFLNAFIAGHTSKVSGELAEPAPVYRGLAG